MELIRDLRLKAGMTQKQLALKVGLAKEAHVSNWERGTALPPVKIVRPLAAALGVESDALFKEVLGRHMNKLKTRMIKGYQAGSEGI